MKKFKAVIAVVAIVGWYAYTDSAYYAVQKFAKAKSGSPFSVVFVGRYDRYTEGSNLARKYDAKMIRVGQKKSVYTVEITRNSHGWSLKSARHSY